MTAPDSSSSNGRRVVSREAWLAARRALLEKEKAFTRQGDELSALQRDLPWELVPKEYLFEGPGGTETLADLFAGRSQLVVYHFMFHPDDKAGCPHCSLRADGFAGIGVHLNHRDVTSDFNFDYQASFTPEEMATKRALYNYTLRDPKAREREGHSIFYKDDAGAVFHTYSCYDRGNDKLNIHYHYLDLVPKGRDEGGRGPYWVRRRDEYDRQRSAWRRPASTSSRNAR